MKRELARKELPRRGLVELAFQQFLFFLVWWWEFSSFFNNNNNNINNARAQGRRAGAGPEPGRGPLGRGGALRRRRRGFCGRGCPQGRAGQGREGRGRGRGQGARGCRGGVFKVESEFLFGGCANFDVTFYASAASEGASLRRLQASLEASTGHAMLVGLSASETLLACLRVEGEGGGSGGSSEATTSSSYFLLHNSSTSLSPRPRGAAPVRSQVGLGQAAVEGRGEGLGRRRGDGRGRRRGAGRRRRRRRCSAKGKARSIRQLSHYPPLSSSTSRGCARRVARATRAC